jgi:hypothetical protein
MNESKTYQTVHQLKVHNSRVSKFAIEVQVRLKKYTFYAMKYAQFNSILLFDRNEKRPYFQLYSAIYVKDFLLLVENWLLNKMNWAHAN